jgi:hypothetical protein
MINETGALKVAESNWANLKRMETLPRCPVARMNSVKFVRALVALKSRIIMFGWKCETRRHVCI